MYLKRMFSVKLPVKWLIMLFFFSTAGSYGQELTVSGKVTDAKSGEPLPFVNVAVKGTTSGTTTDENGDFRLKVPGSRVQLSFSYVGYEDVTVPVDGRNVLNIQMHEVTEKLNEVVVIGYGVQKKSDLSGSVSSVSSDDLIDIPAPDVASALKGKAAGVVVSSTSGMPGATPTIRIRGVSSITASNEPLYIVDGVATNINNLNQYDIKSIEVLKDAASTAIYGAAGANGVILITTKEGSKGKTQVNFAMKAGVQMKPTPIPLLTSQQEYDLLKELNAGNDDFFNIFSDYNYNDRENPANSRIDTVNWANVDWQDEIMQNSTFQEYSLQLNGGGEKTKYLVSALYRNNQGVIKTARADQYIFRMNLTNQVTKRLQITTNANLSRRHQNPVADNTQGWNGALINAAFTYPNFIPIYDPDRPEEFFVNPIRPQFDNPDAWIRGKEQENFSTKLNGLLALKWEIVDGLTFLSRNSVSYGAGNSSTWLSRYDTYVGRNSQGRYTVNYYESLGLGTQNTLTWMHDFGDHSLTAMAGMEVGKGKGQSSGVSGRGFTNDLIKEVTAATEISGRSSHSRDFSAAYFGRINYAFRNKYLAQFNFRADGSAKFGANNRWAQFPSGSVAWKISEEPFFKNNVKAINFLKLRFSYGLSGNKPPYNFMYMALYGLEAHGWEDAAYPVTLTDDLYPGYAIMRMENNDLRWETTTEYNLGLDMNMFKNRIIMSVDMYSRRADDLLYIYEPPVTYYDYSEQGGALGGLLMNIGSTLNRGVELQLETRNLTGRFKWTTQLTFAYNHNEVLDLGKNPSINFDNEQVVAPGYPIYAFWGYEMDRLFQADDFDPNTGRLKDGVPYQPNVAPGDIKFKDNNGDGTVDKDDKVYLGNPSPPVTYSMSNIFTFAGFDLTVFLQGVQGNKIWNRTRVSTEAMINNLHQFATVLDRWTPDHTNTSMPRAVLGDPAQNTRKSDRWVEDGSYLRVKDLILGYTLPEEVTGKTGIDNIRIYFSARNMFTFTKYTGYDPEVRPVDFSGYPQNKTFVFGVNVTF
jgi:TonB-linked SusC/RagA family outer membrane protein